MTQKFNIVPDESTNIPPPSNDNPSHGSFSVYEKGKSPSIDFQLMDGTSEFLRYAHILHGDISKVEDVKGDEIKLLYSTHTVSIKGYCLQKIYNLIKTDQLMSLRENDKRFINAVEDHEPFITQIEIIWRKEEGASGSSE